MLNIHRLTFVHALYAFQCRVSHQLRPQSLDELECDAHPLPVRLIQLLNLQHLYEIRRYAELVHTKDLHYQHDSIFLESLLLHIVHTLSMVHFSEL